VPAGAAAADPTVMTPEKLKAARQLYDPRQHTIAEIAATLGVSRASIYRSLNDTAAGPA
jgi:AcrR family transcriptional regulator